MPSRVWQPPNSLLTRRQRLVERAYREIELARRAPDREAVIEHCKQAAVFMEELADLIRRHGTPPVESSPASSAAIPVR
ncbi:hypothetical protein ACFOMD_00915 [Sphingoaurantiacus capsulatus]|uniref:Uncharacterized protein n=1 Tax=Sphingoaurantiacus capsulatus TaxID=1771310 RepID=A0ABV7X6Q8_9SPHN